MASRSTLKVKLQFAISLIVLVVAIYLIISEPNNSDKLKWAFGIFGLVIGYWLK